MHERRDDEPMTRVTVIDPDRDVLDLYRDLLELFGYEVETYADALPGIGSRSSPAAALTAAPVRYRSVDRR